MVIKKRSGRNPWQKYILCIISQWKFNLSWDAFQVRPVQRLSYPSSFFFSSCLRWCYGVSAKEWMVIKKRTGRNTWQNYILCITSHWKFNLSWDAFQIRPVAKVVLPVKFFFSCLQWNYGVSAIYLQDWFTWYLSQLGFRSDLTRARSDALPFMLEFGSKFV